MKKFTSQNRLLTMNSSSKMDKSSWIVDVRNLFEESELDEDFDTEQVKVCVYNVPDKLRVLKPEAYTPHIIAIGPYHHLRLDLYEMERYKLICAKKVQKELKNFNFEVLVKNIMKREGKIRGCYHKYLEMDGETLAWRMAIDGLFLIEFLHAYANKNNNSSASSARMSFLVNSMGKKLAYDSIVSDVYMLENQIPLFVLKEVMRIQCLSSDEADKLLYSLLIDVCKKHSPLVLNENYPMLKAIERPHLLDLLYHLIVPNVEEDEEKTLQEEGLVVANNVKASLFYVFTQMMSSAASKVISGMKKCKRNCLSLEPCRALLSLLPCFSDMAATSASTLQGAQTSLENESLSNESEAPLVEEIMIPSVFELNNAGIVLSPTNGDVSTLNFEMKSKTLRLPLVHVDGNTDVIMRNLIAYEASAISGPLVFARYAELMNGIVDEPRDSEILRRKNIIVSRLRNDKEVTELWQGMTKAIRLTKVEFIDEAIVGVNRSYKMSPKVIFRKVMKTYVFASWRFLVVFITMWFSGLVSLQSFCSVVNCPNYFHLANNSTAPPPK